MGLLTKDELKKHLSDMGIKVEGEYIKKRDINHIDVQAYHQQEFISLLNKFNALFTELEKAKPKEWSYEQRRDIKVYIDKYFKEAVQTFWSH